MQILTASNKCWKVTAVRPENTCLLAHHSWYRGTQVFLSKISPQLLTTDIMSPPESLKTLRWTLRQKARVCSDRHDGPSKTATFIRRSSFYWSTHTHFLFSSSHLRNVMNIRLHLSHMFHLLVQELQHTTRQIVDLVRDTGQRLGSILFRIIQGGLGLARIDVVSLAIGCQIIQVFMTIPQLSSSLGDFVFQELD